MRPSSGPCGFKTMDLRPAPKSWMDSRSLGLIGARVQSQQTLCYDRNSQLKTGGANLVA
jgi:hypothetical protein